MTVSKLLTTTALAISLSMPVAAQTDQSGQTNQQSQTQQNQQAQGMTIMVSSLIGRSLYMPEGEPQDGQQDQTDASDTSGDAADEGMSEEEQQEVAEGGVEGEAEEIEQSAEDIASDIGQAAEDAGESAEAVWENIAAEVTEVPENWQMVGDIDDVIVTREGEVRALLVDAGGFLGVGETERRIDIENVRFVRDADDEGEYYAVFAGDQQMFEEQGQYDAAQAASQGEMLATENERFQTQVAAEGRGMAEDLDTVAWDNITTEEVLGARVYGSNDEWIGDLSEFNLADDGTIEGVIIDVGGFLGIGEKPVQMSLDQVTLRRYAGDEIRAYVNATEADFEAMPEWPGSDL